MSLDPAESAALREGIRSVLAREASVEAVRKFVDGDAIFEQGLWAKAAELGWLGLAIPEDFGGLGLGFEALAILYEELGRAVAPLPCLGTALAAELILAAGAMAQQQAWLPAIASGAVPASIAVIDPARTAPPCRAERRGDAIILDGDATDLLDGAAAKLLLVPVSEGWVLVAPETDRITVSPDPLVDRTRHLARITFKGLSLPADRFLPGTAKIRDRIVGHAALALACDAVGGAAAIFDETIAYLKLREQFGKPIGTFQALKHRCADHKVAIEASAAVVEAAVQTWAEGQADAALQASLAKLYACDVYAAVATDAVQLHGGIGFTWEHACHLYLKRAKLDQALFGTSAAHADHAGRLLAAA